MQSAFTALEDDQFLTFVILFYPPVPMTNYPPLQTTPITSPESGPRPRLLLFTEFHLVLTFSLRSYSIVAFGIWFNKELRFHIPGLYIFAPVSARVQHTIGLTRIVGSPCLMAAFLGEDVRRRAPRGPYGTQGLPPPTPRSAHPWILGETPRGEFLSPIRTTRGDCISADPDEGQGCTRPQ